MKEFPCKNCLVKSCCSEQCDKIINDNNTINLYIKGLGICPDCGASLCKFFHNKVICFSCKKVFIYRLEKHCSSQIGLVKGIIFPLNIKHYNVEIIDSKRIELFQGTYKRSYTTDKYAETLKNTIPNLDPRLRKRSGVIYKN